MIESIEKLRESLKDCTSEAGVEPNRFDTYWITARACDMLIDEIEREIAEKYMELPVDADGVPIRVGDHMECDGEAFTVCAVAPGQVHRWKVGIIGKSETVSIAYPPCQCRHVKPRTIEDVLVDMLETAVGYSDAHTEVSLVAVEKCADEIRELMEVDR